MGDSPSEESDESMEAAERFDDQQTGNFGGGVTNVSDPTESRDFAGDTAQARDFTERQYKRGQGEVREKAFMGGVPGFSERLNPTIEQQQEFARQQNEIDERGYDPTQEQINVGPGDIFGLKEQIGNKISQGGTAVSNNMGQIVGATGQTPMFGIPFLPDVTTYTGRNEYNPFGDPTIGGDDNNNEPDIIRRRMSAETVPIQEEDDPVLSDDLAINYLQNPYYGYSGQGNLYQPYGYANNTLVDLLRTRNMTQPQQRAANLGLFGNPGDFS